MKIIVITNHIIGLPAIQELAKANLLKGVITSNTHPTFLSKLTPLIQQFQLPLLKINKVNLEKKLTVFLKNKKAELIFVMLFKYKIPAKVLTIPKWGFINFHPSALPLYGGPDPIFWQIKNQVKQSALTAHLMDAQFDTGAIVASMPFKIEAGMTHSQVLNELPFFVVRLVGIILQTLQNFGRLLFKSQDKTQATYQKRPTQKALQIDWKNQDAPAINALVNACNPSYGGAIAFLRHQPIQILQVSPLSTTKQLSTGTIIIENKKDLLVACNSNQLLRIDIVQIGEGIVTGEKFIKIANIQSGEVFNFSK